MSQRVSNIFSTTIMGDSLRKRFSIVTPSYNSSEFISATIESVLSQSYENWELIIVDDGSIDNTISVVAKYVLQDERIQWFQRSRNPKGASVCRNIGIEKSVGEFILFLDADDLLHPDCLKQRMKVVEQFPSYDFYVFNMAVLAANIYSSVKIINKYPAQKEYYLNFFLQLLHPWPITAPLWRKEVLKVVGGFTESYQRLQDPEMHIRVLLKNSYSFIVLKELPPDCFYRLPPKGSGKYRNKGFVHKVRSSYYQFYSEMISHLNEVPDNESLLKSLRAGFKKVIFNEYYLESSSGSTDAINLIKLLFTTSTIGRSAYFLLITYSLAQNKLPSMIKKYLRYSIYKVLS